MKFPWCIALILAFFLFSSSAVQAADYPPDKVCPIKDADGNDLCKPEEYVDACLTYPNTHLANIKISGKLVVRCVDNAPLPTTELQPAYYRGTIEWYFSEGCVPVTCELPVPDPCVAPSFSCPGDTSGTCYSSPDVCPDCKVNDCWYSTFGCPVPNTTPYAGTVPMPWNTCVSTETTPCGYDSYNWFCEDNANYHPECGPLGYKCILNQPPICPGIPPHHLEPVSGYPNAYICVPTDPTSVPTCSSTETLTEQFPGPPPSYACIQTWPWTGATLPSNPCPAGESLVSDGMNPPRYGCVLTNSCAAGEEMIMTSPPGTMPITYGCQTPSTPTACPSGQNMFSDASTNPVTYYCCPNPQILDMTTKICVDPPTVPVPTCPPGQTAVPGPSGTDFVCQDNPTATCPPGQHVEYTTWPAYICVADGATVPPICPPGDIMTVSPGPIYTCTTPPPLPSCPAGQYVVVVSSSPLTYGCGGGGN